MPSDGVEDLELLLLLNSLSFSNMDFCDRDLGGGSVGGACLDRTSPLTGETVEVEVFLELRDLFLKGLLLELG